MELHDKLSDFEHLLFEPGSNEEAGLQTSTNELEDTVSALVNLGYQQNIAIQALESVRKKFGDQTKEMKIEGLIREALKALA